MKQISKNAFALNLPAYMNIYSIVNIEYLKLYESFILSNDEGYLDYILPSLDDLAPNTMD